MSDLDAAIRERLDGLAPTTDDLQSVAGFTAPAAAPELTPEQEAEFRAELKAAMGRPHEIRVVPPGPRFYPGFEPMRAALLAVLDLHKLETEHSWEIYRPSWTPERAPSGPLCSQCSAGQEHQVPWPCPTVRAIAQALDVEVPGA